MNNVLEQARSQSVPVDVAYFQDKVEEIFGFGLPQAKLWREHAGPLLEIYRVAVGIASRPSPHQVAWDSSFVKAWNIERSKPRTTDQGAFLLATRAMGQPRPRGRQRYAVEGIIESVQARLQLASIAQAFSAASSREKPTVVLRWTLLATFLLESSLQDARLAQQVALDSLMYRQSMHVSVSVFNAKFLLFRHHVKNELSGCLSQDRRHELVRLSSQQLNEALEEARRVPKEELLEDEGWLLENHSNPLKTISDDWATLTVSLGRDTFIQPVTRLERLDIIKAMKLYSAGHFYQCINGHPFVIGECGGAMQQARCPECGETIGGSNHTLAAGNTFDNEMEDLSIEAGLDANPFPWGRR